MSLRGKLVLGFSIVSLLSLVVGLIGIRNMGRINTSAATMYQKELLGLSYAKEANLNLLYADRAQKDCLLASSIEEREQYRQTWETHVRQAEALLDEAATRYVTEAGIQSIKTAKDALEAWEAVTDRVFDLAAREDLHQASQAAILSTGEGQTTLDALDTALEEVSARKESNAKGLADAAVVLYHSSLTLMIIVVAGALLLGVTIGLFLSSSVLKTVGGEPAFIAKIADNVAEIGRAHV